MTNERAIELLNRISDSQFDGPHGDERREALSMAVRALVSQQTVNDSQGLVNDCISRKAVMKEFSDFVRKSNNSDFAPTPTWNDAVSLVGSIPSVQPQACDDAISRKMAIDAFEPEHDTDWYTPTIIEVLEALPSAQPTQTNAQPETHDKRTETQVCDLISRQAAIDIVRNRVKRFTTACVLAVTEIEQLPPAQQEENLKSCKNCTHFTHAYKLPCKNCRRNEMLPDWYEEVCNNG